MDTGTVSRWCDICDADREERIGSNESVVNNVMTHLLFVFIQNRCGPTMFAAQMTLERQFGRVQSGVIVEVLFQIKLLGACGACVVLDFQVHHFNVRSCVVAR